MAGRNRETTPLLYGVGDCPVISRKDASSLLIKGRETWGGMLERCYCPKFRNRNKNYIKTIVCDEWHNFETFYIWYEFNYVEGWFLDKDLIDGKGLVYSPETCVYVPRWLNNLLLDSNNSRGIYPIGVTEDRGKFKARFSFNSTSKYLGIFDSVQEASFAYNEAKGTHILNCINRPDVPLVVKSTLKKAAMNLLGG